MKAVLIILVFFISGCAQLFDNKPSVVDGTIWDFDHNIQFEQHKKSDNVYSLTIRSTSKTRFSTLATFLVRQSFKLCKSYGYKIEVLDGVESYNDERYITSFIPASLQANIECAPVVAQ
ncbi:hypothetical protein WNY51_16890 [Pseudocolwellia sp. AS88]|jgi:hypothetical protein|uniref:hypothetical protein n=1 Tax=Pseudocolwellia sp. AS88 TaxID=3063958 RepID=UPI0026F203FA|nr:hypothetical protein [Pseudocolwellia sp. AS88]MDO7086447.1 hypothetical protein [Pseudocolwellia sp. AS88]